MPDWIDFIAQQFSSNQFASGGALLMVFGGLLAAMRNLPMALWRWIKKRLLTHFTMTSHDRTYAAIRYWLDAHPYMRTCRNLRLKTVEIEDPDDPSGTEVHRRMLLMPSYGSHFLRHDGRWYWLHISEENQDGSDDRYGREPIERLSITTLGDARNHIANILEEAWRLHQDASDVGPRSYVYRYRGWQVLDRLPEKPEGSLILAEDLLSRVKADVHDFLANKAWYARMGIPWHRGYLLYGEPGNGKSSLVLSLASQLCMDLYCLNLAQSGLSDNELIEMLSEIPKKSLVLLEEVDTIFEHRQRAPGASQSGLSFGGLLNALDGYAAKEGRVLFMTTNHRDRLDPALIRPGRIDIQAYLGNATQEQIEMMFGRFFPDASSAKARMFALQIPSGSLSMATIQEHLLRHRCNPDETIKAASSLADAGTDPCLANAS